MMRFSIKRFINIKYAQKWMSYIQQVCQSKAQLGTLRITNERSLALKTIWADNISLVIQAKLNLAYFVKLT